MSYDIYCYKSKLGRPDLEEAQDAIENEEEITAASDQETKLKVAKALIDFNPILESFEFNYEEIAKLQESTVDQAKEAFDHIELNTPEGELATQIIILDNSVSILIPYWYSGDDAKEVFEKISGYLKIIHQTAGYFVYDPQTERAFDPLIEDLFEPGIYQQMTTHIAQMVNEKSQKSETKPWWKFW